MSQGSAVTEVRAAKSSRKNCQERRSEYKISGLRRMEGRSRFIGALIQVQKPALPKQRHYAMLHFQPRIRDGPALASLSKFMISTYSSVLQNGIIGLTLRGLSIYRNKWLSLRLKRISVLNSPEERRQPSKCTIVRIGCPVMYRQVT